MEKLLQTLIDESPRQRRLLVLLGVLAGVFVAVAIALGVAGLVVANSEYLRSGVGLLPTALVLSVAFAFAFEISRSAGKQSIRKLREMRFEGLHRRWKA